MDFSLAELAAVLPAAPCSVRLRLHHQAQQRNEHGGQISVDKCELVERYEALGDEDDFRAARRLFEQELTGQSGALDRRQYGYLLECHGRRTLRRAVDQYEQAMSLDPDQDKVQYQWMQAKAALGEPEDAITRGGSGHAVKFGSQPDRIDVMCLQQRTSRIDRSDGPAELGQVLAPSPP
jgi:hypothetical protein